MQLSGLNRWSGRRESNPCPKLGKLAFTLKNAGMAAILAILLGLNWKMNGKWGRDGNGISEVGFGANQAGDIGAF
jgi:hypothetical protein